MVRRILDSYDEGTIDRAYELVSHVLESEDRCGDQIDSKAHAILAFSATLLTVVIPWTAKTIFTYPSVLEIVGIVIVGGIAAVAVACSFLALRAQSWPGYEDQALFPKPSGEGNDKLKAKRFWAVAKFKMHASIRETLQRKSVHLRRGQSAFLLSIGLLLAVVIEALFRS